MHRVPSKLTSHKKGEEKQNFRTRIIENRDILERVQAICNVYISDSRKFQLDRDSFNSNDWQNRMAYEFGYQKALEDIVQLLTIGGKDV